MLGTPLKPMAEPGRAGAPPTFAACSTWFIELRRSHWTSPKQAVRWERTLSRHAYPHIGQKGVDQITQADIVAVLEPIWASYQETALVLWHRIRAVLDWAASQEYRGQNNPADHRLILPSLPERTRSKPHQALSYTEIPAALRRVERSNAYHLTQWALTFMVLTVARPRDVRFAKWREIDWEQGIWTVPAARVRVRWARVQQPHYVPLSDEATWILEDAWDLSGLEGGLIFPSEQSECLMSDATLLRLLQRLGIASVPSGFRNSFRDWCAENEVPRELVEASLSLTKGGHSSDAASPRSDVDALEQRRGLMQAWADFCLPGGWAVEGA